MSWLKALFNLLLKFFNVNNNKAGHKQAPVPSSGTSSTEQPESSGDKNISASGVSDETIASINILKAEVEKIKNEAKEELDRNKKTEKQAKESLDTAKETKTLVWLGFIAILVVVIGIAFGYWQFIYTASNNEDYRYGLMEQLKFQKIQINELNSSISEFKKMQDILDCQKGKKYWQYEQCFK